MNQPTLSKITIDRAELETLKQQAMEIALRVHVLQGGNLLDELTPAPPESQKKRTLTRLEIATLAFIFVSAVGAVIAAFVLKQPFFLLLGAGVSVAHSIYDALKKNSVKKKGALA